MQAYSPDLREHVVRVVVAGQPETAVARSFSVSVATVSTYVRLHRAARSLAPGKSSGRPPLIPSAELGALEEQLITHWDATLAEHVGLWEASHGVRVSVSGMWRAIKRLAWTFK
jgi:transposase